MTDHSWAKSIFAEIQARPYSLSPAPGVPSNNCFFKGIELLQRLGILGYAVRGRVAETHWDRAIVPARILDLLPSDILTTHFYTEVLVDGMWRVVDPSFQPSLAKVGFTIGSWDEGGQSCFPIAKLYSQAESIEYQRKWFDPDYQRDFFERGGTCWRALDDWFAQLAKDGGAA